MRSRRFQLLAGPLSAAVALSTAPPAIAEALYTRASIEAGRAPKVYMVRVGVQGDFKYRWLERDGRHVSAYWDASLAQWRGDAYRGVHGNRQHITSIGFTPTLRYAADSGRGWYAEGGIGGHLLSHHYNNDGRELSTAFQFGDHLGLGYVFDSGWEIAAKVQHFSNGGIKKPNSGVNFFFVKAARAF